VNRARLAVILSITAALVLIAAIMLRGGGARMLFHEVYERVSGAEVLGPDAARDPPTDSPYLRWLAAANGRVPMSTSAVIADVELAELRPWPDKGQGVSGLYLRLEGEQLMDARLLELPPGGATLSERHLYEKGIYFLGGPGHSVFELGDSPPRRVDWQAGSLLSIPLNTRYRHVNDSDAPVRLLAVTTFPFVLNSFDNETFIHQSDFDFRDRYDGSADYFQVGEYTAPDWLTTHFVRDIRHSGIADVAIRGEGNRAMHWEMAGNRMLSLHVSEIPPGQFKKAHRHSNGSVFLLLSGSGYTLSWPARAEHRRQRIDWQAGSFFAPPPYWYHQHFNPGDEPARYLSINTPDLLKHLGLRFTDQVETGQPELRAAFEKEKAEHGQR
jgi:uncharacterized RmlC-like cupin family protein